MDSSDTRTEVPEHLTKKAKVWNQLVFFMLGVIAVGIGFLMYWALTGTDVLTINNAPVPVQPSFVKNKEKVKINIDFCKHEDTKGRVVRKLVSDKSEILAPVEMETIPSGCYNDFPIEVPIPDQAVAGRYKIVYRIEYKTNPFHNVTEEIVSQEFEVVN